VAEARAWGTRRVQERLGSGQSGSGRRSPAGRRFRSSRTLSGRRAVVGFISMLSMTLRLWVPASPERRHAGPGRSHGCSAGGGPRRGERKGHKGWLWPESQVARGRFCRCAADEVFRHVRENNAEEVKTARFRETENASCLAGCMGAAARPFLGGSGLEIWLATDFRMARMGGVGGRRVRTATTMMWIGRHG
jgi:hypothetical protein